MAEKQVIWKQEKLNNGTRQWWIRAVLLMPVQLLLMYGVTRLARNIFGMQENVSSLKYKLLMLLMMAGFCFWYEWKAYNAELSPKTKMLGNGALWVGLGLLVWLFYGRDLEELRVGLQTLGNTYLHRFSIQARSFRLGENSAVAIQTALELLLLLLMWLVQIICHIARKCKVILCIPISIVCAGLLVMALPEWKDLTILLISGMVLIYLDSSGGIAWKRMLVLVAGILFIISVAGGHQEDAEKQMLSMNGDWFQFWEKLGENIEEEIDDFELPEWSVNKDIIDNKPPNFDEEQVILLTMNEKPVRSIYLRGYHCKDYADGAWNKDTNMFEEACEKYGIRQEEATEKLILFPYEQENILDNRRVLYELSEMHTGDNYCYLPYGLGWEEIPENVALSQDYIVESKIGSREIEVFGWQQLYHLDASVNVTMEYSPFQEWYNEYAYENYLMVSDEQKAVKELAEEMSEEAAFAPYLLYLDAKKYSGEEVNASRLQVANLVAGYLKAQGTYSLELDTLPPGADTIEYFLENSKEGFCEHFASAGTLLLRELGIPARYTRGYIVKTGVVKNMGDCYTASVLDSYAHAWAEIYLENYGWIPIEMTPGYSSSNITPQPEVTATPQPDDTPKDTEQMPTEAPKDEEAVQDQVKQEEEVSEETGLGENENATQNDLGSVIGKTLVAMVLVVFVAGGGFVGYRYRMGNKERGRKRLTGYLRRGDTRKAVKWINGEIYRQLVHKDYKFRRLSDVQFVAALKSEFPEVEEGCWDAYFAIVRRAAYSADRISMEEAKECLDLYKVVWQNSKKR